jgi:hypothetical protein
MVGGTGLAIISGALGARRHEDQGGGVRASDTIIKAMSCTVGARTLKSVDGQQCNLKRFPFLVILNIEMLNNGVA